MHMPLFAKNLCFDIIMYVFLSFIHIYLVLFKPLLMPQVLLCHKRKLMI